MGWRKITLILLALMLILPLLISCSEALQDKMADSFIDKMIGNKPKPIEVEPVDLYLSFNLFVLDKDNFPAYPSLVEFYGLHQMKTGYKEGEKYNIDKYVRSDGTVPMVEMIFKKVYPEDNIIYGYGVPNALYDKKTDSISGYQIIYNANGKKTYYHEVKNVIKLGFSKKQSPQYFK